MPRIETIKVGLIWVAWNENDYGVKTYSRIGFTENQARSRVAQALFARGEI